jgi:NAD(P)-dependent dehydrogenase (short-subunit alcohol dehydrogenase family)
MSRILEQRVAVVTGAGRGIGQAIALAFAREGADLALAARTRSELERVADEARALGRRALVAPTDMTDEAAVGRLAEAALGAYGRVDVLVNNAGWGTFKPIVALTLAEWEDTLAVNLRSAFLGCRAFAPAMIAQRSGCILNMASMSAHRGTPDYGPYSAAKAGLLRLTETLAAELKPHGIRVLCLCPGPVASRLRSHHFPDEDPASIMQPERVAAVALFAASDAAGGMSGAFLNINHY